MATFMKPPRPENAIPFDSIQTFESRGWWGQVKKNGTCSIIIVSPDGELTGYNRHGEIHKAWKFTDKSAKFFRKAAQPDGDTTFVAELLNNKVSDMRDINYVHDILRDNGRVLYDRSYAYRYNRVREIFDPFATDETEDYYILDPNTWVAKNMTTGFVDRAKHLDRPEDEGLVFKNPKSVFSPHNKGWAVKYRKPTKNFGF